LPLLASRQRHKRVENHFGLKNDERRNKRRTNEVALAIINMTEEMPSKLTSIHIARQIVRSATSVAANYRAVCRSRSDKEFIAKLDGKVN
jgi:hypothetical protein